MPPNIPRFEALLAAGEISQEFKDWVRDECARQGKTVKQVSLEMGHAPNYLSSLFIREHEMPSIEKMLYIAGHLGYVVEVSLRKLDEL